MNYFFYNLFSFNLYTIIIREGRGISKYDNGASYDGEWKNN
jgi:hypothetical protein